MKSHIYVAPPKPDTRTDAQKHKDSHKARMLWTQLLAFGGLFNTEGSLPPKFDNMENESDD